MAVERGTIEEQRNAEMSAGSGYPPEYGTKPGGYGPGSSGNGSDTGNDQSASGDDASNGGSPGNTPPAGSPPTSGEGGASADGGNALPGIGDIVDLGGSDGASLDLAGEGTPLQPVFDTVNGAVGDVSGSGLLEDVVEVANTAGVGTIGAAPAADGHSNLITDTLNLPGGILAGDLNGSLSNISADLNDTLNATTGLLNNVLGTGGLPTDQILGGGAGNLVGDVVALPGNALDGGIPQVIGDLTGRAGGAEGLGGSGLLQPVTNLVDSSGGDLQNNAVASVTGDGSLGGIVSGDAGNLGGSSSGNAAHAEIGGQTDDGLGLGVLSSSDTGHTAGINVLDVGSDGPEIANLSLLSETDGLNAPVLDGIGLADVTGGDTGDLLTVNGGNNADNGGVIGGVVGNLEGSSSGHLIDADAGPQDDGLGVGILAGQPDGDNTANVSAVDVGSDGPQLADLGVLTDADIISIPSLDGAGLDSLTGNLLGSTALAGDTGVDSSSPVVASLGDSLDLLPGSITGDHGIVDVSGHHII